MSDNLQVTETYTNLNHITKQSPNCYEYSFIIYPVFNVLRKPVTTRKCGN